MIICKNHRSGTKVPGPTFKHSIQNLRISKYIQRDLCPSYIYPIVFSIPMGLQLQYIGVSAEEGRRMGRALCTPPSSAWIVIRHSRLKIGTGVTAAFEIDVFGALPSRYGVDNTAAIWTAPCADSDGRTPRFGTGTTVARGAGRIVIEGSLSPRTLHSRVISSTA
jgi:hypothetical protein